MMKNIWRLLKFWKKKDNSGSAHSTRPDNKIGVSKEQKVNHHKSSHNSGNSGNSGTKKRTYLPSSDEYIYGTHKGKTYSERKSEYYTNYVKHISIQKCNAQEELAGGTEKIKLLNEMKNIEQRIINSQNKTTERIENKIDDLATKTANLHFEGIPSSSDLYFPKLVKENQQLKQMNNKKSEFKEYVQDISIHKSSSQQELTGDIEKIEFLDKLKNIENKIDDLVKAANSHFEAISPSSGSHLSKLDNENKQLIQTNNKKSEFKECIKDINIHKSSSQQELAGGEEQNIELLEKLKSIEQRFSTQNRTTERIEKKIDDLTKKAADLHFEAIPSSSDLYLSKLVKENKQLKQINNKLIDKINNDYYTSYGAQKSIRIIIYPKSENRIDQTNAMCIQ